MELNFKYQWKIKKKIFEKLLISITIISLRSVTRVWPRVTILQEEAAATFEAASLIGFSSLSWKIKKNRLGIETRKLKSVNHFLRIRNNYVLINLLIDYSLFHLMKISDCSILF